MIVAACVLTLFTQPIQAQCENVELTTQAQVDDFSCNEVAGNLRITGANITNLNGLSALTSVGGSLYVRHNASLDRFCGLFPLLDVGGLIGSYIVSDNSLNPTRAEIQATGPCILDPVDEIAELIAALDVLGLPQGLENSLLSKLHNALAKLLDGNPDNDHAACNELAAFVNQVDAQDGKKIDPLEADALIAQAMVIIDVVCP